MRHTYPISDHFDGKRFFNPDVVPSSRNLLQLLHWRLWGERATWPAKVANSPFPPPPDAVPAGSASITFINHASFLIRFPGAVVLTDPIHSERCSPVSWAGPRRARPPGIALEDLPRPDIVVLSHNHYDHMDVPTLRDIHRRHAPRFVTTLGNAKQLRCLGIDAVELDWWQDLTIGPVHITCTRARHFSARTLFDRNHTLWGGFMLRTEHGQVLFAGDSAAGPHWREIRDRLGAPDVALLPIGAYEPRWFMAAAHMNPAEAVDAHQDLQSRQSIGMHFGTFQLTDEAVQAPLEALAGLNPDRFTALEFGESRLFPLNSDRGS